MNCAVVTKLKWIDSKLKRTTRAATTEHSARPWTLIAMASIIKVFLIANCFEIARSKPTETDSREERGSRDEAEKDGRAA